MTILYEVNEIRMDDPVPFLKKTVQLANPSDAYHIVHAGSIGVYNVFKHRTEVDAIVCVQCIIPSLTVSKE